MPKHLFVAYADDCPSPHLLESSREGLTVLCGSSVANPYNSTITRDINEVDCHNCLAKYILQRREEGFKLWI